MASRDTKLNIIVDAQNRAASGLNSAKQSLDRMNVSVEKIGHSLQSMGKYGAVAFAALSAASAKLINDSAQSLQIEESYRRMTAQANISADALLKNLKRTSAGTVSSTNLMLSANRAMALGVADNMETVTDLMEIARLKGRALGLDTTQAFNDIVTGIGRGSPLILDNLGITIKLGEAQEMYAQKLGKTAAELTDTEKKQALLNAVLESGRAEVAAAGEVQVSAAEKLQSLKAQFSDTADTLGRTLIPAATQLLEAITPVIEKVARWIEQNPELTKNIIIAAMAVTGLIAAAGALSAVLLAFNPVAAGVVAAVGGIVFAVTQVMGIINVLQKEWDLVWLGMKLTVSNVVNSIIGLVEGMLNKVIGAINKVIKSINRVIEKAADVTGMDFKTLGTLDSVDLGRLDTEKMVQRYNDDRFGPQQVVITGNTLLDEDAAEKMGDLVMQRLKLSNAL